MFRRSQLSVVAALAILIQVTGAGPALGTLYPGSAGQTPESLCAGHASHPTGGSVASFAEFMQRFGGRFKSNQEAEWAWRVYQAVNLSGDTVVLGRLADNGAYVGKPGYCVLSDLPNWTLAINDVFVYAATDRRATFLMVSELPPEIMSGGDHINPQQVEKNRDSYWRVIYNHEIHVIVRTGKYHLPKEFKPPVRVAASFTKPSGYDLSGEWVFTWTWSVTSVDFVGTVSGGPRVFTFKGRVLGGGNAIWTAKEGSASCSLNAANHEAATMTCDASFANCQDGPACTWSGKTSNGTFSAMTYGHGKKFDYEGRYGKGTGTSATSTPGPPAGIDLFALKPKS